jgi:hypothetical protein
MEHSPNEPALEALASLIDRLDIPETTDEKLAIEDAVFAPALVNGNAPNIKGEVVTKVADWNAK